MIGRDEEVNKMSDIMQMIELYERYGSINNVAKELNISRNTIKSISIRFNQFFTWDSVQAQKIYEIT